MGASSEFYDGAQLKIPPMRLEVFLRHLSYWGRKAFYHDWYNKAKELFNFKCNIVPCFSKLRDTTTELDSKETFLKTWNSLLNINENLITQLS